MRHSIGSYTQGRTAGELAYADLRFLSGRKTAARKAAPRKPPLPRLPGS